MKPNFIKSWKDELNRRWYLFDSDPYPYVSATSVVAIPKAYRYDRNDYNDEESESKRVGKDDKAKKNLRLAGKKGTDVHSVLEAHNRAILGQEFDVDPKLCVRYAQILTNYIAKVELITMNEGEVKVIDIERSCCNPIFKYAGRVDLLVTVNGEYEVWDYKTSRKVYEEDGWQLVAYMEALKLEGIDVKRVRIIHIDKISSKITDLKYVYHEYMFNKFLGLLETFKGMFYNDLLKGRIHDIDDLGVKYKWPKEELTNNYVVWYNLNKGDYDMKLEEVTGLGDGATFTKDPNKVSFPENEPVMGVVLGAVMSRWVHKAGRDKVFVCEGKATCERCKLEMKKSVQFRANFLTIDDMDKPVIKKIDSESVRLYFALVEAINAIKDSGGDPKTAVLAITRTGTKYDTKYSVANVEPKHKAFKDIAATIAPMEAFDLAFSPSKSESDQTVDRTDIVEK
jgi:hypothetical protein